MEVDSTTWEPLVQPTIDGDEPLTQTVPHTLQHSNVHLVLWVSQGNANKLEVIAWWCNIT